MKRLSGLNNTLRLLLAAAALAAGSVLAQEDGPVIYAIINEQDAGALAELFEGQTGLQPTILRGSTGEIIARVLAEQDNPRADIVLGGPSTLHINLKDEGATEPHELPEGLVLEEGTFDPDGYWTGWHATALGIGINTQRFAARYGDQDYPQTWEDLLADDWSGEIVMTDPVASSTAYLFVQLQLQRLGWEAGWDYLEALAGQVGQLPGSGAAPTQLVSSGEYTLGVSYIHPLSRNLAQGMPLHIVVPPETGGEIGAVSVVRGGPNGEAAHRFVNFILSAEAQQLFTERSLTTPLNPEVVLPEGTVPVTDIDLIDFDPELAAEQRDEVLELWSSLVD
ncbi:MAG TPA: ABC transporter substrate-binding protein [Deinococcales bacterium]|nr:ABC transporter substrate-binding protein [Deinococcales bacterium]